MVAGLAQAQVRGISYTLTPLGERYQFSDEAGLKNDFLYGGRLGFGFGEFVEVGGVYLFNDDVETDWSAFADLEEGAFAGLENVPARSLRLARYGAELKLNLARGSIVPYVSAGTGILRFEPEGLGETETIYLTGSAGLQFSLADRYALSLGARSLSYRYDPATTLLSAADLQAAGLEADAFGTRQVSSFGLMAGLQVYLGGRRPGELSALDRALRDQLSGGMGGLALQVEPFAGRADFDEALGLRAEQRLAGVAAGFQLGPYVGLRGFYWRGVEDDAWETESLQAYGGELKLDFAPPGGGLTPFVVLGGGYLDVGDDYVGNDVALPEDRPFLQAGGGLSLPLGSAVALHGGVRALLMSTDDVDDVAAPSQVQRSWMYTAGLTVALGRQARPAGAMLEAQRAAEREALVAGQERLEADLDSLRDALAEVRRRQAEAPEPFAAVPDTVVRLVREEVRFVQRADGGVDTLRYAVQEPARRARPPAAPQQIVLPVLPEGEYHIRFGPPPVAPTPPALQPEQVRALIAETVAAELGARAGTPEAARLQARLEERLLAMDRARTTAAADSARLDRLERRFAERLAALEQQLDRAAQQIDRTAQQSDRRDLDRLEQRLVERLNRIERERPAQPDRFVVATDTAGQVTFVEVPVPDRGLRPVAWYPLVGFNLTSRPQLIVGLRGTFTGRFLGPLLFTPELVLGRGLNKGSANLNANLLYPLGLELDALYGVRPYVGLGVGFLSLGGLDAVFNTVLGAEATYGGGVFFVEYMNQNLFDYNRFAAGYRFLF